METVNQLSRSEKIQLTKEIKAVAEFIADMEEQKQRQGDKYFYNFDGRKCERWMLHGDFFFPSSIIREKKYLAELKEKRK